MSLNQCPENQPYRSAADLYRAQEWAAPLPLPRRKKENPPTGLTGRGAPYPCKGQIEEWVRSRGIGNIGLRMPTVGAHDVIGIDTDHYGDKRGATQLRALVAEYGRLPRTWTSSARSDRRSGIRYFLAPAGLLWVGKADKDIDVISPGYRYAVVWPSIHPDGMTYRWYPPEQRPDGVHYAEGIPDARKLPILPSAWVDLLTNGREFDEGVEVDVESTDDQVIRWAREALPGYTAEPCARMRRDTDRWLAAIESDPSSHDKVSGAHWNLLRNAAEGHSGWSAAIAEVEATWRADVLTRRKRTRRQADTEIERSKAKALRKLKGDNDAHAAISLDYIATACTCASEVVTTGRIYRPRSPRTPRRPRRCSA